MAAKAVGKAPKGYRVLFGGMTSLWAALKTYCAISLLCCAERNRAALYGF